MTTTVVNEPTPATLAAPVDHLAAAQLRTLAGVLHWASRHPIAAGPVAEVLATLHHQARDLSWTCEPDA